MKKLQERYRFLVASALVFFSLQGAATPLENAAHKDVSNPTKVTVVNLDSGKWELMFNVPSNGAIATKEKSRANEFALANLKTFTSTPEQLTSDLMDYIRHYYKSATHNFSLTLDNPDGNSESDRVGYSFCLTTIAQPIQMHCKALNLSIAQSDFLGLLQQSGVEYRIVNVQA